MAEIYKDTTGLALEFAVPNAIVTEAKLLGMDRP